MLSTLLLSSALLVVSAGADIVTTELALSRPGFAERNPAMQSRAVRVLSKAAAAGVTEAIARHFEHTGHKRAAKITRWTAIGLWGGAAIWNAAQMSRRRR
jgi:hypothetical protein